MIDEFFDHYEGECRNLLKAQEDLKSKVVNYTECMANTAIIGRIQKGIKLLDVEPRLLRTLHSVLRCTFVLREEETYRDFADYRVRHKMAPAAHKQEYKDCYIWGTFLALIHKLEPVSPYIAFMTTNKDDYQKGNKLCPQLVTDCYKPSMHIILGIGKLRGDIDAALGNP